MIGSIPVLPGLPGIRAFFTTRHGGVSQGAFGSLNLSFFSGDDPARVRENWKRVRQSQGLEGKTLVLPRLSHGANMREITGAGPLSDPESPADAALADTDAVFTGESEWLLGVTMGDCLAALIADPETRCVAAVHAGWRGTRENILGRALGRLFSSGRCRPATTRIALGPCLSSAALEISGELAQTLPPGHVHAAEGRFTFDLRGCNREQAVAAGALPSRISEAGGCTRSEPGRFFSYRRDGAASGRMAACIALV